MCGGSRRVFSVGPGTCAIEGGRRGTGKERRCRNAKSDSSEGSYSSSRLEEGGKGERASTKDAKG